MKPLTTRILPSDIPIVAEVAVNLSISKSKLYRLCCDFASRTKPAPRSIREMPCSELKETSFLASPQDARRWRGAAAAQQLTFHTWVRECAIANCTHPDIATAALESREYDPHHYIAEDDERTLLTVSITGRQERLFKRGAASQKLFLSEWVRTTLTQAANHYIANPLP